MGGRQEPALASSRGGLVGGCCLAVAVAPEQASVPEEATAEAAEAVLLR